MSESWNKKERQKMKVKQRQDKAQKMQERKENAKKGKSLDAMMAYVDENGNLSSTPPDRRKKVEIRAEDIEIGVPKLIAKGSEQQRCGFAGNPGNGEQHAGDDPGANCFERHHQDHFPHRRAHGNCRLAQAVGNQPQHVFGGANDHRDGQER